MEIGKHILSVDSGLIFIDGEYFMEPIGAYFLNLVHENIKYEDKDCKDKMIINKNDTSILMHLAIFKTAKIYSDYILIGTEKGDCEGPAVNITAFRIPLTKDISTILKTGKFECNVELVGMTELGYNEIQGIAEPYYLYEFETV